MKKQYYLIGTGDMPGMAVIATNAKTESGVLKKLIETAVRENMDVAKVKVKKLSDFNHKTFQQEALIEISDEDEMTTEVVYLTPISIYQ